MVGSTGRGRRVSGSGGHGSPNTTRASRAGSPAVSTVVQRAARRLEAKDAIAEGTRSDGRDRTFTTPIERSCAGPRAGLGDDRNCACRDHRCAGCQWPLVDHGEHSLGGFSCELRNTRLGIGAPDQVLVLKAQAQTQESLTRQGPQLPGPRRERDHPRFAERHKWPTCR